MMLAQIENPLNKDSHRFKRKQISEENQTEVKLWYQGDFRGTAKLGKKKPVVIMVHSSNLTKTITLKMARTKISGHKTVTCLLGSRTSAAALSFPTKC